MARTYDFGIFEFRVNGSLTGRMKRSSRRKSRRGGSRRRPNTRQRAKSRLY